VPKRTGRPPITTRTDLERTALELFTSRGFAETTVDDVADAAGIARRTFFRYFGSKNDLVWGEFDSLLDQLATWLAEAPPERPLLAAVRDAVIRFNTFPAEAELPHRQRMSLILYVPALQAHSTLRYARWREVIARFAARRLGEPEDGFAAQLMGHVALAAALTAYEQWLQRPDAAITELLAHAFDSVDLTGPA
jgi:mycofactocin system transcriptional regulator